MLIFLPVVLLLLSLVGLGLAARLRPNFRTYWLVGLAGSGLTWLSLLLLRARLPLEYSFAYWQPALGNGLRLSWQLDQNTWPIAFALGSLLLAFHLVQVPHIAERRGFFWLPGLLLTILSLLAVLSGNIPAFLLDITLVDLAVLAAHGILGQDEGDLRRSLASFSAKLLSSVILLWALIAYGAGGGLQISPAPAEALLPLVLALGIRLGVLPFNPFIHQGNESLPEPFPLIFAAELAPAFAWLARLAIPLERLQTPILLLVLLAGLYAAARWGLAQRGRGNWLHWLAAGCALALAAAIVGLPQAAIAWAVSLILGGGLLLFLRLRPSLRSPLLALGVFLLSGLPFSPIYPAVSLYVSPANALQYGFLLIHGLLLLGWARQLLAQPPDESRLERWEMVIYASGLSLLALAFLGTGFALGAGSQPALSLANLLPALVVLALAGGVALAERRLPSPLLKSGSLLESVFSLTWLYRLAGIFLEQVARLLRLFSALLEGRAGVLWALLVVALLLSLIAQLRVAG